MFGLESIRRIFAVEIPKIELSFRELIFTEIQITGGLVLTVYTYEKGTCGILPFMFSAISLGGAYNIFKILRRASSSTGRPRSCSAVDFASGTFTFSSGLFAFSEFLKRNDTIWIPCLALAATGYYFATSAIYRLDTVLGIDPYRKGCQLMVEPALVVSAATYLFYFRNHTEEWLKVLPFIVIATAGLKISNRGSLGRMNMYNDKKLIPKAIELMMGSCFLCIGSTALVIYCSNRDFSLPWLYFTGFWSFHGFFLFLASLVCLEGCVETKASVFYRLCAMGGGPIVALLAFIGMESAKVPLIRHIFIFAIGSGIILCGKSTTELAFLVPAPHFMIYYQRVIGIILTMQFSLFTVEFVSNEKWRRTLVTLPLLAAAIYGTYDGFRKPIDDSDLFPAMS